MDSNILSTSAAASVLLLVLTFVLFQRLLIPKLTRAKHTDHVDIANDDLREPGALVKDLKAALPDGVATLPFDDYVAFKQSMNAYWARQEREIVPACVVRPRDTRHLVATVKIIKREFDERQKLGGLQRTAESLFAVRGGGHSPVPNAANISGGIVIDLSCFREVTVSEDRSCVMIGAGAKWMDVSKVLDSKGLAVVGGRDSDVGVGGLTLGGGLSFFSPRFGLVCSNIIEYEIVLASGLLTTASASENPDLWRALKGGSNNFGIVTRFTTRSFPCTNIWSGFLFLPSWQTTKHLKAFHDYVGESGNSATYDVHSAGPICSFSYVQKLGCQFNCMNLVYTKPPTRKSHWPDHWKKSSFASLWRIWSTCKSRTLTSATDELHGLDPPGQRQLFVTTTIKNDITTITSAYAIYQSAINTIHGARVADLVWSLIFQPLLPDWVRKGDPNPLGLHNVSEPLLVVNCNVHWRERRDDVLVTTSVRRTIEQIEAMATVNGTGHPWRYLNYCAEWQRPFESYGEENWRFLKGVSRKYDPDGLFQRGCVGGFKLGME
ncbi:MAG: hypothetical protein Q9160_002885 [Pyrenula sp. 1 TL-2023]